MCESETPLRGTRCARSRCAAARCARGLA